METYKIEFKESGYCIRKFDISNERKAREVYKAFLGKYIRFSSQDRLQLRRVVK